MNSLQRLILQVNDVFRRQARYIRREKYGHANRRRVGREAPVALTYSFRDGASKGRTGSRNSRLHFRGATERSGDGGYARANATNCARGVQYNGQVKRWKLVNVTYAERAYTSSSNRRGTKRPRVSSSKMILCV